MEQLNDHKLVVGIKNGSSKAIRYIYENMYNYCTSFVLNNSGDRNDAKETFQEAMIILHRNVLKDDFELKSQLKVYLFSILKNKWRQKLEKKRRKGNIVAIDADDAVIQLVDEDRSDEKIEAEKKYAAIKQGLEHIKDPCKKIILDFYYRKKSLSKLAEELNYTLKFMKVKKSRCMKSLRQKALSNHQN